MLADPRHSRIILINPSRTEAGKMRAGFSERRRESMSLLSAALDVFGVATYVFENCEHGLEPSRMGEAVSVLDGDGLSLWKDQRFTSQIADSNTGVVVLGGAWLEEDVLIGALEGVKLGYDVRVLADLSIARCETDRSLALNRLGLHGVLTTTVRQMLLEWAACLDDHSVRQKVRQLLR